MESRLEISDRFAAMWRTSREDSGKSQDYVARYLGVSKKTVQNWEAGLSSPSQAKGFEWFQALGLSPLPYYIKALYPSEFAELSTESSENEITDALIAIVKDLPEEYKRKLLYMLCGGHGSSAIGIIEMVTAHLQTPLRQRLNIAESILTNYEMAVSEDQVTQPEHIQPNIELLEDFFLKGKEAVKSKKSGYSML